MRVPRNAGHFVETRHACPARSPTPRADTHGVSLQASAPCVGILARLLRQPCPQRVGNDVTCGLQQRFFPPQRMVVIPALPDPVATHQSAAARFEDVHAGGEGAGSEFDQPMHVVGHHHPGMRAAATAALHVAYCFDDGVGVLGHLEPWSPMVGDRGEDVEGPRPPTPARVEGVSWTWEQGGAVGADRVSAEATARRRGTPCVSGRQRVVAGSTWDTHGVSLRGARVICRNRCGRPAGA